SNFAGNQPVRMTNNRIANNATGVHVQSNGSAVLLENDLGGNTVFALRNDTAVAISADRNWWGSNLAAAVAAEVSGPVNQVPWLASGTDLSGATGFQPFLWATTTGSVTTLAGSAGADTGSIVAGDPVTMTMNGESATTALAELLDLRIVLDDGADVFTLDAIGVPATIDTGAGVDTLIGPAGSADWQITAADGGSITGVVTSFTGAENLTGRSGADNFFFVSPGILSGALDGGLGNDVLDLTASPGATANVTGPGSLDGVAGTSSVLGSGFDNINGIIGSPADVVVTKSGPASVDAGAPITYTITVTNAGPNPAVDVTLTDVLPSGTTFSSLAAPAGWTCSTPAVGAAGTVTCTQISLPPGAAAFTLIVTAPATAGTLTNTANVTSANEGSPGNETSAAMTNVVVPEADLAITKSGPAALASGANVTYTVTVTNNGPRDATSVRVTDNIPAGLTLVSATPSQGTCAGNPALVCDLGTIANGAGATITIQATVTTAAPVTNTATVQAAQPDPNPLNNSSTTVGALAIPTMSEWLLMLMLAALALSGALRLR
ncbi:MAG TPA: DUF11 domain-containing protein, partial [Thermoanaerobaculia bacterium]|nr:DUF11 domain-containing protein [Thermoanaerobaculia bacterium]